MKSLILFLLLITNVFSFDYGELLFNGNCVTCHLKKTKDSAPSINEIRKHYINAFPEEKDFVNYMSQWILNPSEKTSIMQHSIDEFELMPDLAYDEETLKEISKYIYNTDFEKKQ